jgi:carbon monoxide dehydrogenase subunit G
VKLDNSFLVPASKAVAWETLLDVPSMVSCMPGAELAGQTGEDAWKVNMKVKFGPIGLNFATDVTQEEADEAAGRVLLKAKARETKGRGGAQATIVSTLTEVDEGTRVDISTDVLLSGPVAQYGRGLVQDVSNEMVGQFAENMRAQIGTGEAEAAAPAAAGAPAGDGVAVASGDGVPAASANGASMASPVEGGAPAGSAPVAAPPRPAPAPVKPVSGFKIGLKVLRAMIARLFRRGG